MPQGPKPRTNEQAYKQLLREAVWENDCLIVQGRHTKAAGHVCISVQGKNDVAHRVSWKHHNGAIPDGLFVLHRCDRPRCINVEHLFLGTTSDNIKDMWRKNRGKAPTKLSDSEVKFIRDNPQITALELSFSMGVHKNTIGNIRRGITYKAAQF